MSIYLQETDEIYFSATKKYFQEVISSYNIGNYRSANVMLYSVAICDILLKLQELQDMYNDQSAKKILEKIKNKKAKDEKDPTWENTLLEEVKEKTKLLDAVAYTHLRHLKDDRNYSAHPAMNENFELVAPSKETTIANIKNVLQDILVKPPIFIKNVIDMLTDDLQSKKDLYENEDKKLAIYLKNKYYSKMDDSMKKETIKTLWKFCFCRPGNIDCMNNLEINRRALQILIEDFRDKTIEYIKENRGYFAVASDKSCRKNLVLFLGEYPLLYEELDETTKLAISKYIDSENSAKAVSWFLYKNVSEHLEMLAGLADLELDDEAVRHMKRYYSDIGETGKLIDFIIAYYGESFSYDCANERFEYAVKPFLDDMSEKQLEKLISVSDKNSQIYGRRLARTANTLIMETAKGKLDQDFQYSDYHNFMRSISIVDDIWQNI